MGALTSNRKRTDECFNLHGLLNSSYSNHPNQIDNPKAKKPRISCTGKEVITSVVSRLSKYPEPEKLRREVHAPCRSTRFGFLSGRPKWIRQKGNALFANYKRVKDTALSSLRFVNYEEETEVIDLEAEPPKDSRDDGNEVVSDDHRVLQSNGLEGSFMMSDLTKADDARKFLGSMSLDRESYKNLLSTVEKSYSFRLSNLDFEIKSTEAQLQFIRLEKPQEEKKPAGEDILREPFVPLTEEEEREVAHALSHSNRRKILVTHENSNIEITGEILQCLRPGAWLNDEVINLYLELLKERERREPKKFLNCHFFNTFFYKKLIGGRNGYDYKAVRRWTTQRKLGYGLVDCDKIFVPIHKEVHWCLAVINKDKSFQYLDSLGGRDRQILRVLARYFMDEVKDKSGQEIDVSSWDQEFVDDLPEQQNGFDCGVFMIKYADFYSRGLGLHFSQENMPYFRLRTAKEILRLRAD